MRAEIDYLRGPNDSHVDRYAPVNWKCPKLAPVTIVADDAYLAAHLSCAFARKGEYVPVVDGPRLTRPDANAEAIRRNNVVARAKSNLIILAGVSDESFRLLSQKIRSKRIRRVDHINDLDGLPYRQTLNSAPLIWGKNRIGVGLLKALRSNTQIVFSDLASPTENIQSESGHLVVCEEGNDLSQVMAANYAFALRAGLVLIPEVPRQVSDEILERFYSSDQNREVPQSTIVDNLRSQIRRLCSFVEVPENGSITFITGSIPYGFAFPEAPSTHLFKYPDLGISIVNGFSAEQDGTPGVTVAALINPETVEAPELESTIRSLAPRGVFIREYKGRTATVQHISEMIEFFPYDLLMIATHCGDATGYRWTYEFTDSEGIDRTLVVDIAIGVASTNDDDMLNVLQFTNFVSLDGVDWHDPEKKEALYVGNAILDYVERTGEGGKLEPVKKEHIDRVTWSAALKMYDHNYIAVPRAMANGRTPIVINNACGSWHRLAETFTFSNARAYVGTLFPISTSEVQEVMARLIEKDFQKPLAAALWAAQRQVYKGTSRRPYIVTGVYTQWLRATDRNVPRDIYRRLQEAHTEWVSFLSGIVPTDKMFRATKEIVDYHARELKHFHSLLRSR
jgi:hypothetical protein